MGNLIRPNTHGADFLQLNSASAPSRGKAQWLAHHLRDAVRDGRLQDGEALPPTRFLAHELGISRGVVTEAYERIAAEGLVEGHGRAGTRVRSRVVAADRAPVAGPAPHTYARPTSTAGFDALRAATAPVDLTPGVPDVKAFPRAAWLRAERRVLDAVDADALGYGNPQGSVALREAISRRIAVTRGIQVDPDQILVVAGVAQSLSLLATVLTRKGVAAVAVEDPGSLGARQQLQAWGVTTPPITVDDEGLVVDHLWSSGAQVVMTTPAHQFPTGVVLSPARRRELLRWADQGGMIIEDDYDADHRYDRHPVAAIAATHPESIFYTGSVSKLLSPALRIGWLIPPSSSLSTFVDVKRDTDLGNATLPQLVLAELMRSGDLESHLRTLSRRHRRRRDLTVELIRDLMPDATVHGAAAGVHLTITWSRPFSDTALAEACLVAGVKTQPLSWHRQRPGPPGLVLGYAASNDTSLRTGIETIARGVTEIRAQLDIASVG